MVVEGTTYSIHTFDDYVFITPPRWLWYEPNFIGKHILNSEHIDNLKFKNLIDRFNKYRQECSFLLLLCLYKYNEDNSLIKGLNNHDVDNLYSLNEWLEYIFYAPGNIQYCFRFIECLNSIDKFLLNLHSKIEFVADS